MADHSLFHSLLKSEFADPKIPAQLPDAEFFRLESDQDAKIIIREAYENALRSIQSEALPESSTIPDLDQQGTLLPSTGNIDWFGEVVDVHLNGDVSVRLGAADEVKDIKIAVERCVFVTNASRGMDMSESSGGKQIAELVLLSNPNASTYSRWSETGNTGFLYPSLDSFTN